MSRIKRRLIAGLTIALVLGAVYGGVAFVREVRGRPKEAYALWWTADLVIDYMDCHDGAWPKSWDDLRDNAERARDVTQSTEPGGSVNVEFRPKPNIEELERLVEIDWDANPDELLKASRRGVEPPFRAIYLRNGRSTHYQGREPNQMILEYLESRRLRKAK
jgi:hypothetical protein